MSLIEPSSGPDDRVPPRRTVDAFLEAKLHWPRVREGWVDRQRLVDLFDQATRRPVALIAAPAGYGKTTLAAQWLATGRGGRAAAWVSVDAADNDPGRLWTHVATALQRAGCALAPDAAGFMAANSGDLIAGLLPRLVNAMASMDEDIVLILDDFHYLQAADCREQVEFLIENLPEQAHLVIVSRADPGLRLGRLRASGLLAEIRADQLSFDSDEAARLLGAEQVQLSAPGLAHLMGQTEGWPAGVYLAALSLSDRSDADELVRSRGVNRPVRHQLLRRRGAQPGLGPVARVHPHHVDPRPLLCAAVRRGRRHDRFGTASRRAGAAEPVPGPARRRWSLVPLPPPVRGSRPQRAGGPARRSHRRSCTSARRSGTARTVTSQRRSRTCAPPVCRGEAARLIQANWLTFVDAGRAPTVASWLQSLGRNPTGPDPDEEVTAAWMAALFGDVAGLARHVQSLEGYADHGPLPDGSRSVESAVSLIHGLFGYGGPVDDARGGGDEPWSSRRTDSRRSTPSRNVSLGHAAYVAGELNLATETLAKGVLSEAAPAIIRVFGLSVQSLAEDELGRFERSRELAERAMETVEVAAAAHPSPSRPGLRGARSGPGDGGKG